MGGTGVIILQAGRTFGYEVARAGIVGIGFCGLGIQGATWVILILSMLKIVLPFVI
jgi:hypothetical protein